MPRRLRATRRVDPSLSALMRFPPASYFLGRSGGPAPEPSFPRLQPALDFADQVEGTAETDPVTRTPEPVSQAKRLEGVTRGPYPVGETPGGACDGRRILGPGTALPGPGRDQSVGQGQQSLQ